MSNQAVKAGSKERMIEVKVRFFTNNMAGKRGYIVPKHGWTNGSIQMDRNDSHQIEPGSPKMFNSLMEIPAVIEKVLIDHEIKLHRVRKASKYLE